jgi:hypothetical protein
MAIGVFGLQVAYKLKRLEIMSLDDTHGWFGGGANPTPAVVSTVDRIDFSNDTGTANIRGPLSVAKRDSTATGNSNYGWFGGGYIPTPAVVSTVDRIDFANDSVAVSVRGPLSIERGFLAATGNSNYGWFAGGMNPSVTPTIFHSRVDRIDFSNDSSTTSPRGPLSIRKGLFTATGNSNYGWFGGGYTGPGAPGFLTTVDRIDFSNDSPSTTTRGPLNSSPTYGQGKQGLAATGNFNYGWFAGGSDAATPILNVVDRIDFSNDTTTAASRGLLLVAKNRMGATGNSNYGWFGGGQPGPVATVDRIDFSNDSSTVSVRGPLSSARFGLAATSGQAKGPAIKLQKAGNYGWFGGGYNINGQLSYVDRIDFSNDSATISPRGLLSLERRKFAATGNSNYGWFGGGTQLSGALATVDRIDFSNNSPSTSASPRGPLSSARYNLAATGNSNYGWFGGGRGGSPIATVATVDRIDFSNDSATAIPRSQLSASRYSLAATGNSNYGWFGGGAPLPTVATVNRIDFSNDNTTISIRGPLFTARYRLAATGNSNYGWFGGGTPGPLSTVDRIDFSNDSVTASPRGPLSSARDQLAATGNSNYGWFGGGSPAGTPAANATDIVDRINFANDSVSASPRGTLTVSRNSLAATSNTPT